MTTPSSSSENEKKNYQNLSYYTLFIIAMMFIAVMSLPFLHVEIEEHRSLSVIFGSSMYLFSLIPCGVFTYLIKENKEFYGFGKIDDIRTRFLRVIITSSLFCLAALALKYFIILSGSVAETTPLFSISQFSSLTDILERISEGFLYLLFVPVQVFIFHSCFQSPLIKYVKIPKYHFSISVFASTVFFAGSHFAYGLDTVLLVLPVIAFWCYYYSKHQSFYTICLSHFIIGYLLLYIIGIQPITNRLSAKLS